MSAAFDGSGYRQRVLAALRRRSSVDLDDPFFVADLDPAASMTDADVQAHLVRVVAFLQRERNSAKYAGLAAELIRRRADWEAPLLDGATRQQLRLHVIAARSSGDAERLAKVDGYLATVRERFGGVPASRVAGLRRLAAAAGVPAAVFDERLGRERIIPDTVGGGVEPLDAAVRRQIRDRLDELRTLRGGDRVGTASLWSLLDLPADASAHRVRTAYEALVDRNARRGRDREKTVTADLLAMVRARLVEADPAAYTAGVLEDAAAHIRPSVEEHVVLDGEVTPAAYEGLVRQLLAAGHGLPVMQARAVVAEVARDLGALVSTGAVVDYVVCGGCGRPEPVNGAQMCRYCDTNLYTTCTTCGWAAEAASVVCRHCGSSLRQAKQAADALALVRQALEDGRPRAAAEALAQTRTLVAALGPPVSLAAEELNARVQASLAAANAGWRALTDNLDARREDAAADGARWLAAQAVDVPGPDGRTAAEVLADLTAHQNVIRRRVEAAGSLPLEAREAALVAVLASAADNREALAALASLPLSPPTGFTASPAGGSMMLRWRPSASVGPVSYRVVRLVADGSSPDGLARRSLGTTRATELSDAGSPVGVVVRYEVTAVAGDRTSEPVTTAPVLVVDDVADLEAEQTDQGVHLSWRLDTVDDTVTVERSVQAPPSNEPVQRTRADGGGLLDTAASVGTTYTYRVFVEYTDPDGSPARTSGAEVTITVQGRPEPVLGLAASSADGQTTLRWGAAPELEVRVYAAPADAGLAPLGPEFAVIDLASIGGPIRLVGTSRRGRLVDTASSGDVVYVPITVIADAVGGSAGVGAGGTDGEGWLSDGQSAHPRARGVVGRALRHAAVAAVRDLRATDHGDEIVVSFQPPPGVTETLLVWRRDRMPTGPDDPQAEAVRVSNASLEITGGWRLPAPRDGWGYYVACYPLYLSDGQAKPAPVGVELVARAATREDPAPPGAGHPSGALVGASADLGGTDGGRTPPIGTRLPGPPTATGSLPVVVPMPGGGERDQRTVVAAAAVPTTASAAEVVTGPNSDPLASSTAAAMAAAGMTAATMSAASAGSAGSAASAASRAADPGNPGSATGGGVGAGAAASASASTGGSNRNGSSGRQPTTVVYTVGRAGRRRRTLRVHVSADGPAPELVLVAKPGPAPPEGAADGHTVSRLPASTLPASRTLDVPLDGAALPWGIRLVPAAGGDVDLSVRHPPTDALVVR